MSIDWLLSLFLVLYFLMPLCLVPARNQTEITVFLLCTNAVVIENDIEEECGECERARRKILSILIVN